MLSKIFSPVVFSALVASRRFKGRSHFGCGSAAPSLRCSSQPPGTVLVRSAFRTGDTLMVGRKNFPFREEMSSTPNTAQNSLGRHPYGRKSPFRLPEAWLPVGRRTGRHYPQSGCIKFNVPCTLANTSKRQQIRAKIVYLLRRQIRRLAVAVVPVARGQKVTHCGG
jgi:hypothetical protein